MSTYYDGWSEGYLDRPFGDSKKRKPRKVTAVQMEEIKQRRLDGETAMELALEFGITAGYIRQFAPTK